MNFEFSESQLAIRDTAKQFAEEVLAPEAAVRDEREEFPREAVKKLGNSAFWG